MRTLLITDLHLNSKIKGLLDAQVECFLKIYEEEGPDEVIIMGDVFNYRKPSPSELVAFQKILDSFGQGDVTVLRGNHDSETKADDGVTALSVFEDFNVDVITHTQHNHAKERVYIPHYENEETIIAALEMVPEGYPVFGHFGYAGCLNSVGDADSELSLSNFRTNTFLGHIHGYREGQGGLPEARSRVICLGSPYSTNYGEAFKDSYYAILYQDLYIKTNDVKVEVKKCMHGPRHLIYKAADVEKNLSTINDPNYYTFLRVMVGSDHHPIPYDQLKVAHLDVKYTPVFNEDDISAYVPERDLFSLNEVIISDYVDGARSSIPTEILMEGYRLLKDED